MKKMVSRMSALLMMVSFGIFFLVVTASAAPIVGEIQFEGSSQLTDGSFVPVNDFATAQGLIFSDVTVKLAVGDFDGLNDESAQYKNFIFDSFVGPVSPLWAVGPFKFTLETLEIVMHTAEMLGLKGMGILTANGYDDTKGAWILTTQTVTGLTGITFSAASGSVAVPEPGTLLLLGSGLAGLALYRRRGMNK